MDFRLRFCFLSYFCFEGDAFDVIFFTHYTQSSHFVNHSQKKQPPFFHLYFRLPLMDVSHLSTNNEGDLAYKRFPIFTVKINPDRAGVPFALVCPMPRYSVNSFYVEQCFFHKATLPCFCSAIINILLPYCFALRYVTMGVLIWLFPFLQKGLSGIDRISPLTFFIFFCFFFCCLFFFLLFRLGFFCSRLPVGGICFHIFHIKLSCRRVPYFLIDGALLPFLLFSGCD